MEEKIKSIKALVTAFESRNEQLHEEIKKNEEAIDEMKAELSDLEQQEQSGEQQLKMVF